MPVDRRMKTKTPEEIPGAGDPDRKRVLNVLAQRRYRQRRREKIAALEAQSKSQSPPQPLNPTQDRGVPLEPRCITTAPLQTPTDDRDQVEELIRSSEDFGLPMMDFEQDPLLFEDFNFCNLPTPIPSITTSPSSSSLASPPSLNFPLSSDGAQLEVPILSTIHAFTRIATALNIMHVVWDLDYMHTLSPVPSPNLPVNLHPTPAQISILHHPILDAIPWPSVREKLICVLSLPSMCRPPVAQEDDPVCTAQSKAVQRLAHDLDDMQEGVKIHGNMVGWGDSNELVEEAWEMGECFFRNWWWCVDQKSIETTNRRRKERGLGVLRLKG